jgi:hypothetical protein
MKTTMFSFVSSWLLLLPVISGFIVGDYEDNSSFDYFVRVRQGGGTSVEEPTVSTTRTLQASYEDMYNLPAPELFFCDDSASFVLRFDVSDYLLDSMFTYDMYRHDSDGKCTININNNAYLAPGMTFDSTPRGIGNGTRQVAMYLKADSNIIESSEIYYTKVCYVL